MIQVAGLIAFNRMVLSIRTRCETISMSSSGRANCVSGFRFNRDYPQSNFSNIGPISVSQTISDEHLFVWQTQTEFAIRESMLFDHLS